MICPEVVSSGRFAYYSKVDEVCVFFHLRSKCTNRAQYLLVFASQADHAAGGIALQDAPLTTPKRITHMVCFVANPSSMPSVPAVLRVHDCYSCFDFLTCFQLK